MSDETQFAGFAGLLFRELDIMFIDLASERFYRDHETALKTEQKIRDYIAVRSYDLVTHVIDDQIEYGNIEQGLPEYIMSRIPDMTTWPEETNKE